MPAAWAIAGSAALGAGASLYAGQKQADAADAARKMQNQQFQASKKQMAPWVQTGKAAQNELNLLMGIGYDDTADTLMKKYIKDFTTYSHKESGGLGGKLGGVVNKAAGAAGKITDAVLPGVGAASVKGLQELGVVSKSGRRTIIDWKGLNKKIQGELARQKAAKEDPRFGSFRKTFSIDDFQKDPGYDFRLGQGNQQLQQSLAAKGGLFSGAAGKALARYNQDFASNEYGLARDRWNQDRATLYNRLAGMSDAGRGAGSQMVNVGMQYAANAGNNLMAGGDAKAAQILGVANAIRGGISDYASYNQNKQMMDLYKSGLGSGYSTPAAGGGSWIT